MEKITEAAQPPPYEALASASNNVRESAQSYDSLAVPPHIMDKMKTIRPHAERMRLITEYTTKKGEIIVTREAALAKQERVLADAIKRVNSDMKKVMGTASWVLWRVAAKRKHFIRGYISANAQYGDLAGERAAFPELIAAGVEEARCAYRLEVEKIEREYRIAARRLDDDYVVCVEVILAEMGGMGESR